MTETMTVRDAAAMQTTMKMSASPLLTASEIAETETTLMKERETEIIRAVNTEEIEATAVTLKSATENENVDTAVIVVIHMMTTDAVLTHLQIVIEIETAGAVIHAGQFNLFFFRCFFLFHVIMFLLLVKSYDWHAFFFCTYTGHPVKI